jgi:hypothetical protein
LSGGSDTTVRHNAPITHTTLKQNTAHKTTQTTKDTLHTMNTMKIHLTATNTIARFEFHCISITGFDNSERRNGKCFSYLNLVSLRFAVHMRQLIRHFCEACIVVSAPGETFCSRIMIPFVSGLLKLWDELSLRGIEEERRRRRTRELQLSSGTSFRVNQPIRRRFLAWCTEVVCTLKIIDTTRVVQKVKTVCA